jgi:hypothetical protein
LLVTGYLHAELLLKGKNRPECVIPQKPGNVSDAATVAVHAQQSVLTPVWASSGPIAQ